VLKRLLSIPRLWVSLYDIFHATDLICKLKLKDKNILDDWDPFEMLQVKILKLLNKIQRLTLPTEF